MSSNFVPSKLGQALPAPVTNALHSWGTSSLGWLAILAAVVLPVATLFTNGDFTSNLLFGTHDAKVAAFHQLITTFVVSCALTLVGAIGIFIGKGPLGTVMVDKSAPNS